MKVIRVKHPLVNYLLLNYWFNNYLQSLNEKKPGSIENLSDKEIRRKFDSIMEVKNIFATKTREHDKKVLEQSIEETALRMLEEGFEEEVISRITGLSQKNLWELRKKQK